MDEKVTSNGNVQVWAVPVANVADFRSPTADEINTYGVPLEAAIAWDGTTFPPSVARIVVCSPTLIDVEPSAVTVTGSAFFTCV